MSKISQIKSHRSSIWNRATASLATIALASLSHAAYAQDSTAEEDDSNIIIVTAQKKSENIQTVPIAISAIDSTTLDSKVIDDGVDLSFSIPNLTVDIAGASLRGVGNLAVAASSESGLGYHVNGVYLGSPASEAEYYDLARVEVLRGPQGTLYGRNTTAGVLNVITQKATDELEGYVTAGYGNYNSVKLKAAINLPIADGFATRLAGFYLNRDGYTTNLFNGNNIDSRKMFGLRSSTHLEIGSSTTADLVISYFEEDDSRAPRTKGFCIKSRTLGCSASDTGFETPDSRATIFQTLGAVSGVLNPAADYFAGALNPVDPRVVNQDVDPTYFSKEWNGSLEISHDFGDISVTSLTGYQEIRRDSTHDFDQFAATGRLLRPITFDILGNGNLATTSLIQSARRDQGQSRQYFQELRLASDFSGPFNFMIGGNYYNESGKSSALFTHSTIAARQQQVGLSAAFAGLTIESNPLKTESYGFFGELYFDLSDTTRLTCGLRYSHDKKSILTRQIFFNPKADGSVPDFTAGDFEKGVVTGRIVLDHKFSSDVFGYVSASRGYKAGGINPGGTTGQQTFAPEFLNAFEFGLKGTTSDGTFRANLSAFYYDYNDLQIGRVDVTAATTVNTDATVYGAEAEFTVRPDSRFQVDGSIAFLNTKLKGFQSIDEADPFGVARGTVPVLVGGVPLVTARGVVKNLDGNELPSSPNIKIAIGAQYEIPLGGLTLTPRIDHYQQGGFFGSAFNKPTEDYEGYSQTDIKLLLAPEDKKWELRAYVKNLFNNDDITRVAQQGPTAGRFQTVFYLEPRTYGLEGTFRF